MSQCSVSLSDYVEQHMPTVMMLSFVIPSVVVMLNIGAPERILPYLESGMSMTSMCPCPAIVLNFGASELLTHSIL